MRNAYKRLVGKPDRMKTFVSPSHVLKDASESDFKGRWSRGSVFSQEAGKLRDRGSVPGADKRLSYPKVRNGSESTEPAIQ